MDIKCAEIFCILIEREVICAPTHGVIPAKAGIQIKVDLFQLVGIDPRLRGDDTEGLQNKVFSFPMSILKIPIA